MKTPEPLDLETFVPCPGITLIEASAGTGKTYSISNLVARWISEGRFTLSSLLILTFTEAATSELKERIRAELTARKDRFGAEPGSGEQLRRVKSALAEFDQVSIHTIHGFCSRILKEYPYECGIPPRFEIANDDDENRKSVQLQLFRIIQKGFDSLPLAPILVSGKTKDFDTIEKGLPLILKEGSLPLLDASALLRFFTDACQRIHQAMEIWQRDATKLREVFLDKERSPVKLTTYKIPTVEKAFCCFDAWSSNRSESFDKAKHPLELFSRSKLEANVKKNASLPESSFFDACAACAILPSMANKAVAGFRAHLEQQRIKRQIFERGQLRYDDLQKLLHKALHDPQSPLPDILRKRYGAAFIDEFQDTDDTQFQILSRIFCPGNDSGTPAEREHPMILIGDPKQAIYGFRGGDIFTYQAAAQRAIRVFSLDTNWRSSRRINESVNQLIGSSAHPFGFDWIAGHPIKTSPENAHLSIRFPSNPEISGGLHLKLVPSDGTSNTTPLQECAREIRNLIDLQPTICLKPEHRKKGRPVSPSDVAVLLPSNKDVAALKRMLDKVGLPSMILGGASVFESDEASDWLSTMNGIHRSPSNRWIRGALCTRLFAFDATSLSELEEHPEKWDPVMARFEHARALWENGNLPEALSMLSLHFAWKQQLVQSDQPERRLTNHLHLLDLILQYHENRHPSPDALIRWFDERMCDPDPRSDEEILKLEKQEDAITLLTMHKAKGLEFPVVFIPIQPAENNTRYKTKTPFIWHDAGGRRHVAIFDEDVTPEAQDAYARESISEKARTQYVSLTRAKVLCRAYLNCNVKKLSALENWIQKLPADAEPSDADTRDLETRLRDGINQLEHTTQGAVRAIESWGQPPVRQTIMSFAADPAPGDTTPLLEPRDPPPIPHARSFRSFSGMLRGVERATDHDVMPPDDPSIQTQDAPTPAAPDADDLHSFDKGTAVGNLFHAILERADFSNPSQWLTLVSEHLETFGYDRSRWTATFVDLIRKVAGSGLGGLVPAGTLARKDPHSLFREHEFTFPLNFEPEAIREIGTLLEHIPADQSRENVPYHIPFTPATSPTGQSCMRGFIDLWFEHNQRIYLVDWKSNWLGARSEDYDAHSIQQAMNTHHYHLQYLVYICALNRLMRIVRPDYDYNNGFGGVAYVFLRGLDSRNPDASVYCTKPDESLVRACERWLSW